MQRAFHFLLGLMLAWVLAFSSDVHLARAQGRSDLRALMSETESQAAVEGLAARKDAFAERALSALLDGNLRIDAAGAGFIADSSGALTPLEPAGPKQPAQPVSTPSLNNQLRRVIEPVLAGLRLSSADRSVRLGAAEELSKRQSPELAPLIERALGTERDGTVRQKLELALAQVRLQSSDTAQRLSALEIIRKAAEVSFKPELDRLVAKDETGAYREKNEEVRRAANAALGAIETRAFIYSSIGNAFYGLSLGSVLLLVALGLAITFGLMRVINMAHGELLMIGAYATHVVQKLFEAYLPAQVDWYILCALPVAFLASGLVGFAIERTVLRFLYGRPLETLLATWGVSLILIQTVRLIFGAQNVTVANPSWLRGGVELLPGFVLTYSRLAVISFSAIVLLFVWFMLQRTPLGLHVRAVTQNRQMAASMGISTRRVDSLTFAIGSGVAGLGGVALSQLGNVGPELGQAYIVDSFMVVVLGGVGKLAGTLAGAFGLGLVNKLLEPVAGAVLGKIAILVFIILFIQRRPQGLFALKGRAAEVT
ncbi:MAG TPA: urea ABC transporter permease subunit UrtB [Polyangiaceae bacterium]|nr:urea ABC transporter permease subunit UrtB [Polyangiaceae bacterium]